ncbi:MAG: hypothetical protein LRY54_03765 [Alphaproteobacteria bacterium]|nr:hypothetical protein [Alphaproteobacteria bacterium]
MSGILKYALPVIGTVSLGLLWAGAAAPLIASGTPVLQAAFQTAVSGISTQASTVLEGGKIALGKALIAMELV